MPIEPIPEETVFSEQPVDDIWRRLAAFQYPDNVSLLLNSRHPAAATSENLIADVSASIEQASEYFNAARSASLSTRPVQLYYGTVSLLRAYTLVATNVVPTIRDHGLRHQVATSGDGILGDVARVTGGNSGAFSHYCSHLPEGTAFPGGCSVTLADALASIPELHGLLRMSTGNPPRALAVSRSRDAEGAVVDLVEVDDGLLDDFAAVPRLDRVYLQPHRDADRRFILRPRLGTHRDPTTLDLSGRRVLPLGILTDKGPVHSHVLASHLLALFILCSLSRYHPYRWRSFCTSSGRDRLLVEEALRISARLIPNEILNLLEERRVVFSPQRATASETEQTISRDELRKIIKNELASRGIR